MTTPLAPITSRDIQTEFGGPAAPVWISSYYRGGANVPIGTPKSPVDPEFITPTPPGGFIRWGMFRGVSKAAPPGSITFTNNGNFTVPIGYTTITVQSIGGGGGGGGHDSNAGNDSRSGGSGGAGAVVVLASLAVTPGEVFNISVGQGGLNGLFRYPPTTYTTGTGVVNANPGTSSSITRVSNSQVFATAPGGFGGNGGSNDTAAPTDPNHLTSGSGNNGQPGNPLANPNAPSPNRNNYPATPGATNSTIYGAGGFSNTFQNGPPNAGGVPGGNGAVIITWPAIPGFTFTPTISANTSDYNLRNAAIAAGWDGVTPLNATVTINSGITVFASSTATYAFDTGTMSGATLSLINNGTIAGHGGSGGAGSTVDINDFIPSAITGTAGGPALRAQVPITITNNGTVGGGGGGGGGGQAARGGTGADPSRYAIGGGGGGGGRVNGASGAGGSASGGELTDVQGIAGTVGNLSNPGPGGPAATAPLSQIGGGGGAGGGLGASGATGGAASAVDPGPAAATGGATGAAVVGNANITWAVTGTRLGPLT